MKVTTKRVLSLILVVALCLGVYVPGSAAEQSLTFTKVDDSELRSKLFDKMAVSENEDDTYSDTDRVRVSIVLEGTPAIYTVSDLTSFAEDEQAVEYREQLMEVQDGAAEEISDTIGEELDVVWNLTLAANILSANVDFGDIEKIEQIEGVTEVVIEERYFPCVAQEETLDPNMSTSSEMIGSGDVWSAGYTGAGSRIAVIDTGLDTAHQSFDTEAFEYALNEVKTSGKTVSLLEKSEVAAKLSQLNIAQQDSTLTADELYRNAKIPFGYNYMDEDLDITHVNDTEGEHGSHVAGIAAANRYIADGNGNYEPALTSVLTQGVAPDAQLIVMKVFGKGGGAYDSDYMAAIEDAIVLGADSINLSLGSTYGGASTSPTYQALLDSLTLQGAVVTISAGNDGTWQEDTYWGELYDEDINMQTNGTPGSFTNVLTVASVNNIGSTGTVLGFSGVESGVFFNESSDGTNQPITTLDTSGNGTEYDFVLLDNPGVITDDDDKIVTSYLEDLKDVIAGKVVLVNRGTSTFAQKHMAAAAAGAVGCIVMNNQAGTFGMALTNSSATIPCVSITQEDAAKIKAAAKAETDYYTGKITVNSKNQTAISSSAPTMSTFSSWGVPGSLQLKPEITAPGGNIYSVFGTNQGENGTILGGTDQYENLSGTSMAAPQVAGMAAVLAQYWKEQGRTEGQGRRQMTQSLLMSTAVPMQAEDNYVSVMLQGAGVANVNKAMSAHSYLTMTSGTTSGAGDGKVKVELGDDPKKTGVYSFSYMMFNLTDQESIYDLSTSVFTQGLTTVKDTETNKSIACLSTDTVQLSGATVSYRDIRGEETSSITLGAGSSALVTVTIDVSSCDFSAYPNGAYIEAYSFATERTTAEGEEGTVHSIPVLGFYGSWTDASMFDTGMDDDVNDRIPYLYDATDGKTNYLSVLYPDSDDEYYFHGNPVASETGQYYLEDRNSLNSESTLEAYYYTAIRNAAASRIRVTDNNTGEVYYESEDLTNIIGAYHNGKSWNRSVSAADLQWNCTDKTGKKLSEDTEVTVTLQLAPEYYASYKNQNGSQVKTINWDALGDGAALSTTLTIDNTAPELLTASFDDAQNQLEVTVKDNRYLAAIEVIDVASEEELSFDLHHPKESEKGKETSTTLNLTGSTSQPADPGTGDEVMVALMDYAGNIGIFKLKLGEDSTPVAPETMTLSDSSVTLYQNNTAQLSVSFTPFLADETVTWESSNPSVATVDKSGIVSARHAGTAVITVKSTANPQLSCTCTVTVLAANVTLSGILQDTDGTPQRFTWNLGTDSTYRAQGEADTDVRALTAGKIQAENKNVWYQIDSDWNLIQLDPQTGKTLETANEICYCPVYDIAYAENLSILGEEDILVGVYANFLAIAMPAMEEPFSSGWTCMDILSKDEYFTAIAHITPDPDEIDPDVPAADYFAALTTDHRLVRLCICPQNESLTLSWATIDVDGLPGYDIYDASFQSSLVEGEDGALYLSLYTGVRSELYRLDYQEQDGEYHVSLLGRSARNVWPVALASVTNNKQSSGSYSPSPSPSPAPDEPEQEVTPIEDVYTDVSEDDWFAEAVSFAYENGLMHGTGNAKFEPNLELTRSMFVTILYQLSGETTTVSPDFVDIPSDAWYANAAAWAAEAGITSGIGGGKFAPDEPITREQVVVMLYHYAKKAGIAGQAPDDALGLFPDRNDVSDYAEEAMRWAVSCGVIKGSDGKLCPKATATRAQIAAIIQNFCQKHKLV